MYRKIFFRKLNLYRVHIFTNTHIILYTCMDMYIWIYFIVMCIFYMCLVSRRRAYLYCLHFYFLLQLLIIINIYTFYNYVFNYHLEQKLFNLYTLSVISLRKIYQNVQKRFHLSSVCLRSIRVIDLQLKEIITTTTRRVGAKIEATRYRKNRNQKNTFVFVAKSAKT